MNPPSLELDGKKRKLLIHGSCLEALSICSACCREWTINLSLEEFQSGIYEANEPVC